MIIKMMELKEEKIQCMKTKVMTGDFRLYECKSFHVVKKSLENKSEFEQYTKTDKTYTDGVHILCNEPNYRINMITEKGHEHLMWDKDMYKVFILNNDGKTIETI